MGANESAVKESERIREYEGVTLETAMGLLKGYVKVGTDRGNGFVFAGSTDDYKAEREEVDKFLRSRREKACDNAKSNVSSMMSNAHVAVEDYVKELSKAVNGDLEAIVPTYEGYMEFFERRMDVLSKRAGKLRTAREQLEKFKPSGSRIVKKAYPATTSFDPVGTTILIVEGGENGEAWTVAEYRLWLDKRRKAEEVAKNVIPFDSPEYDEVFGDE